MNDVLLEFQAVMPMWSIGVEGHHLWILLHDKKSFRRGLNKLGFRVDVQGPGDTWRYIVGPVYGTVEASTGYDVGCVQTAGQVKQYIEGYISDRKQDAWLTLQMLDAWVPRD